MRGEHVMVRDEVAVVGGGQRAEPGEEVERLKHHVGRAIAS